MKFTVNEQSIYSILKKLYALNLDLLLVYSVFELNPLSSQAKLNYQQAVKILTCLSTILKDEISVSKISQELIPQILDDFDNP